MQAYFWTKTAHLVFVFAWVAAGFYLPRLLVNLLPVLLLVGIVYRVLAKPF